MSNFKLAAIKILRDEGKLLHYEEITKKAIENNLIETSGATPEATMNAQISVDIKLKKEKSAFVRIKPGFYSLNPNFSIKNELDEEKHFEEEEKLNLENIGTQYIGKAGEYLVCSELLFRGYNASVMSVDDGIDIFATKKNTLYNIQVKTSNENKYKTYVFDLRISSLERYNKNNTYYVFVLKESKKIDFLILPYNEIQKNIDLENILVINKNTRYRVNVKLRNNKLYVGNKENDCTYYLNNWDIIR